MLEQRPDGSVREIPPEQCSAPDCGQTLLRPGWGECPQDRCGKMGRTYTCDAGHITMASWHEHRVVPDERPRWHCGYEDPSSSSK